jgi:nitrite reductase (NADH) small subunit
MLIPKSDIPPGGGRTFEVDGRAYAVFHIEGDFYAIDGLCPHAGAPLGDGLLDGCVVTCPWHAWRFDVTTGACAHGPAGNLERATVRDCGTHIELTTR